MAQTKENSGEAKFASCCRGGRGRRGRSRGLFVGGQFFVGFVIECIVVRVEQLEFGVVERRVELGGTKVTIDGQVKDVGGTVVCATVGGNVNVAIGEAMTGIAAVLGDGDSPTVTSVALGNVNGVTLAVGGGQGDATAEKDGKTYKVTGNAVGIDMANPMQPTKKPFELDFTCP